jgi:alkanesulfonate monooxygenase SsuD/methylene tetrahydromethanopterin reductase-like flavin-dependent oxidoreductase (luciferase family)
MRFSIAVNMTRRRADEPMDIVAARAVETVVAAERLGFDVAWAAEHHAIEYTIAPNPLLLLVHWGAQARTIRLGTAVITAPYWNPLRAAGEIALADVLTGGRLEVGFGRGAYQYEFDRMAGGIPQERGGEHLRELIPAVRALWRGDYAHEGRLWRFPLATSVPKPLQQPHPPLWVAARDPDTYTWTIEHGLGVMATPLNNPDSEVERLAGLFTRAVADHPGGRRPRFMVLRRTCVYEDREDWRVPAQAAFADTRVFNGLFYNAAGVVNGFPTPMDPAHDGAARPASAEILRDRLMFGTPDEIVERLRWYAALGVDEYCYGPTGSLPHDIAMRSLELFGCEVMPRLTTTAIRAR